jgi:hypothetical protein
MLNFSAHADHVLQGGLFKIWIQFRYEDKIMTVPFITNL